MRDRPARVGDVHEIAASMPHVKRIEGPKRNSIYQVGGKSFVFFRTPQPDAQDPETGERYPDVIMIWVESESDKLALVQDPDSPFFTTERFDRADRADPGRLVVAGVETPGRRLARRADLVLNDAGRRLDSRGCLDLSISGIACATAS